MTATSATITRNQNGALLATATVDTSGNGTNTYSDGSTATITAWTING